MNFTYLNRGSRLPTVGVLQKMLNARGAHLVVDGVYGSHTFNAVKTFQHNNGLPDNGVVTGNTWIRLAQEFRLPIVDCVDIFDPSLLNNEVSLLRGIGSNPIVYGGLSNGVEQVVNLILNSGVSNVFLLRFHGHGSPAAAGMGDGHGSIEEATYDNGVCDTRVTDLSNERSYIGLRNFSLLGPHLSRLRPIFGTYGCVQFMHCETGQGPQGRALLDLISDRIGVPASAGIETQSGGGVNAFKFEGPTVTALPDGRTLSSWSRSLPEFNGSGF